MDNDRDTGDRYIVAWDVTPRSQRKPPKPSFPWFLLCLLVGCLVVLAIAYLLRN